MLMLGKTTQGQCDKKGILPPRILTPKGVIVGGTHKVQSFEEFDAEMKRLGWNTKNGRLVSQ